MTDALKQRVPPIIHQREKRTRARAMIKHGKDRIFYGELDPKRNLGISQGSRVQKISQSSRPIFWM